MPRPTTSWLSILFGLLALAAARPVQASSGPKIESRFSLNTFTPTSTPADGLSLERAAVLEHLQLGAKASFQLDTDPLTWQRPGDSGSYEQTAVAVDRLIALHLGAALGLFRYAQLAVHLPVYFDKGISGASGGVGDLRLVTKGALRFALGGVDAGLAALVDLSLPTGDAVTLSGQGGVAVTPAVAFDLRGRRVRGGLDLGYAWRSLDERSLVRGPELRAVLGGEAVLTGTTNELLALAEVTLATQTGAFFSREATPVVLEGGLVYAMASGLRLGVGLGTGLSAGVGAPDFRLLTTIGFTPRSFKELAAARHKPAPPPPPPPDADGDSIPLPQDQCPSAAEDFDGFEDADGCPDEDNDRDGIPDRLDACPNEPENKNGVADTDGCPEADADGDLIEDRADQCPKEPEDKDGYADDDGCPDLDNDLDGIDDLMDKCPMLPESQAPKIADGCPDSFLMDGDKVVFSRPFKFVPDSDRPADTSFAVIDELAGAIMSNPDWSKVLLEVHASGSGPGPAKLELTARRAEKIKRLIVAAGVVPERIEAVGMGNRAPLAPATTPDGRKINERVEVRILKQPKQEGK